MMGGEVIDVIGYSGAPVTVLGLGRSGLVAAEALGRSGARVQAWDDDEAARARAAARGVPLVDPASADPADALVISPGIPHLHPEPHPVAAAMRAAGRPIIGEVELLARSCPKASYLGITGTNGKSTTTAMIGHILAESGRKVEVGGNLGVPALELEPLGADGTYVLEMSSYQLELMETARFNIAILLNVSADHLERHGGMDGYVAAKRHIFDRQDANCVAVVGIDDERSHEVCDALRDGPARVVPISSGHAAPGGVYALDGILFDATGGADEAVLELSDIPSLPGSHNWQNAAAAWAACRAMGVEADALATAMRTYPGLAHRQELAAVKGGIAYVNDSKATNADAAARALSCYDNIYWIAGGRPKEGGLDGIEPLLGRVRRAFLVGEAEADFAAFLDRQQVRNERCGDLLTATRRARLVAREEGLDGAVVLLSPACASFDQFKSFEARGDVFKEIVGGLA